MRNFPILFPGSFLFFFCGQVNHCHQKLNCSQVHMTPPNYNYSQFGKTRGWCTQETLDVQPGPSSLDPFLDQSSSFRYPV